MRVAILLYSCSMALAALSASRCDDPPCTPDILLYGSFNHSAANGSTQHWTPSHDASSTATFSNGTFSGSVSAGGFAMAQTGLLTFPSIWGCRGLIVNAKVSPLPKVKDTQYSPLALPS